MSELIRYAFGKSTLGGFIAAMSGAGLVSFEFGDDEAALGRSLAAQFPDAQVERDDASLRQLIHQLELLVDHPDEDPRIKLDPRGSAYEKQVWSLLREIPAGETTTYGALAAKLGTRDARDVTEAISSNRIAILIPCHRVVKKDGSISGYRWGVHRKRALLKRE